MSSKIIIPCIIFALFTASAFAQSGGIIGTPTILTPSGRPMTISEASLTFQAPPKQHAFQVDDIIYVHVRERRTYSNTANNQRRKRIESTAALNAWTKFTGIFSMPTPAMGALPEVGGTIEHQTQNRGRLSREETLDFEIPCRVTDIRDNGNLVIEGTKSSNIGEEGTIITVTGIVRPDTISRDYRVASNQVADLTINEIPSGNVFDTVRRPWGTRMIEHFKPF